MVCNTFRWKEENKDMENNKDIALYDIMTFKEASQRWGISDSTLRMLVRTNKLKEGVDYRKSGNTWLITRSAVVNIYGEETK